MLDNWSATARRVVDAGIMDAIRRRCAFVEPAHLLAALLAEKDAGARAWLEEVMLVDIGELKGLVAPLLVGVPAKTRPGKYSAATAEIIDMMGRYSSGRDKRLVTTLDLLLAIVRQEADPAVEFLRERKITIAQVERGMEGDRYRDA